MENNEVLQPGSQPNSQDSFAADPADPARPELAKTASSPETVQPEPPSEFDGLAIVDFTEEELHMVISALINTGRDIKEEFPIHRAIHARADKLFDLAFRLDEEYAEYFLNEIE